MLRSAAQRGLALNRQPAPDLKPRNPQPGKLERARLQLRQHRPTDLPAFFCAVPRGCIAENKQSSDTHLRTDGGWGKRTTNGSTREARNSSRTRLNLPPPITTHPRRATPPPSRKNPRRADREKWAKRCKRGNSIRLRKCELQQKPSWSIHPFDHSIISFVHALAHLSHASVYWGTIIVQ